MKPNPLLFLSLVLFLFACNSVPPQQKPKKTESFQVYFGLPFESSNLDETNFELFDDNGNLCVAISDTVTKTGGHIEYELSPGKYDYSIKTVFNEQISKQLTINSDSTFSFYSDCYSKVDVIKQEELSTSKVIKLVVMYDYFEDKKDAIEIEKIENQYWLRSEREADGEWANVRMIDSAALIDNFSEFESIIIGNREVENFDEFLKYDYMNSSKVYLKVDTSFLEIRGVKNAILERSFNQMIESLR